VGWLLLFIIVMAFVVIPFTAGAVYESRHSSDAVDSVNPVD
jgi:hypothetical protein